MQFTHRHASAKRRLIKMMYNSRLACAGGHHRLGDRGQLACELLERRVLLSGYGVISAFSDPTGLTPNSPAVDASGDLFGTTVAGSDNAGGTGFGTVYEVAAGSGTITTLASFGYSNGYQPSGGVTLDSAGDVFGTTTYGGPDNAGTVFEVVAGSGSITTLASFANDGSTGEYPKSGVVSDAEGDLFGTTDSGGTNETGTVFEIVAGSSTVTTLGSFSADGSGGYYPQSGVVLDAAGDLFGTAEGGASGDGLIYEVASGSGAITPLVSFTSATGQFPNGLAIDSQGNLFGTTSSDSRFGEGTAFKVAVGSAAITTLAYFPANGSDGENPIGSVTLDSIDDLFGTTQNGGAHSSGTAFEVHAGTDAITNLASFNSGDGAVPGVAMDSGGDIFGATTTGAFGDGSVFEIPSGTGAVSTLASFNPNNGENPYAGVIVDSAGNLFGTTAFGGADGSGTVYEVPAGSDVIDTIASFTNAMGAPYSGLVENSAGDLFGTTDPRGQGDGIVFEIAAGNKTITTLASFDGTDGQDPSGGDMVTDSAGDLFGTTSVGGQNGFGTVFEVQAGGIASGNAVITPLASFTTAIGGYDHSSFPYYVSVSGIVLDSAGDLFGTTTGGTSNMGVIYEIPHGSNTLESLVSFDSSTGTTPSGQIAIDSVGDLFGATAGVAANGSEVNGGTLFEVAGAGIANHAAAITTLALFGGDEGSTPTSGVSIDSAGNLFGITTEGAADGFGALYEFIRQTGTFITLQPFDGSNGNGLGAGGIVLSPTGEIYGTSDYGGNTGAGGLTDGVIFDYSFVPSTTTVTADPAQTLFGQTVTLTATVAAGSGSDIPTGTVQFESNGVDIDAPVAIDPASGIATDTPSDLNIGIYSIVAIYSGDLEFSGSTSAPANLVVSQVNAAPTSTTFTDSGPNPSDTSEPVAFTATVAGGVAEGDAVSLEDTSDDNAVIGTGTLNSNGSATIDVPSFAAGGALDVGTHDLIAVFGGDANFLASSSAQITQMVNPAATTTRVINASATYNQSNSIMLSATVTANGQPVGEGSVNFNVSGRAANGVFVFRTVTSATVTNGLATASLSPAGLGVGLYNISASYISIANMPNYTNSVSPVAGTLSVAGVSVNWTSTGGGSWTNPANWSNGMVPGSNDNVTIPAGAGTIFIPSGTTGVNNLTANAPVQVQFGATLTVDGTGTFNDGLTITSGGLVDFAADPLVMVVSGLTISSGGTLNLGDNDLVVENGALSTVTAEVASGYDGGSWTGTGIVSTSAQADPSHLTTLGVIANISAKGSALYGSGTALGSFDGYSPAPGDILVKLTYLGDANLNGQVDGSDYSLIDNGALHHLTGWYNGDLNYDGVIDGSDYTLIDNAYNTQGPSLAAEVADAVSPKAKFSQKKVAATNLFETDTPATRAEASVDSVESSMNRKDLLDQLSLQM